jgi:hypothetical protein
MDRVSFAIECDGHVADEFAASLSDGTGAVVMSGTKRNLGGASETVIQIVQVSIAAGGAIVPLITSWVTRGNVRKIRLGDLEIENPSREQVETLWSQYLTDKRDNGQ